MTCTLFNCIHEMLWNVHYTHGAYWKIFFSHLIRCFQAIMTLSMMRASRDYKLLIEAWAHYLIYWTFILVVACTPCSIGIFLCFDCNLFFECLFLFPWAWFGIFRDRRFYLSMMVYFLCFVILFPHFCLCACLVIKTPSLLDAFIRWGDIPAQF
jgi:hypothetical protein